MASWKWYSGSYAGGLTAKLRAGPCSTPWSTGRITSLPVPASVPAVSRRARFVSVPGLSLPYQDRISFTRSLIKALLENPAYPASPSSLTTLLHELGDETGPPRLMTGAEAGAVVAVEVFVEKQQIAPVRVALELLRVAVHGPSAVAPAQKEPDEPARQLPGDVPEVEPPVRAARTLDLQVVAIKVVELLQRLDEQVVHREPERAAPVGVAAEERGRGLGGLVAHAMLHAIHGQHVGMRAVVARQRADAVRRQELVAIEHVAQHARELRSIDDREQPADAAAGDGLRVEVGAELRPIVDEPLQATHEARQPIDDVRLERLHREERNEPDHRADLQLADFAVGVQHVIVEAIRLVPQREALAAEVVHGPGDVDEVLEELRSNVLVRRVRLGELQRD